MTITVVCDVMGSKKNGTIIAEENLIDYLRSKGHTVRVLCCDQEKKGRPDYYVVPNKSYGRLLDEYVAKIGVSLAKAEDSVIRAAVEGADLVHVMMPLTLGCAACRLCQELHVPLTAGFHMQAQNLTGYLKLQDWDFANDFVYKVIYKKLYRHCSAIHYPTKFIRDVFESRVGVVTPGYVISNGVADYVVKREVSKPEEHKDKYIIVTTGRYCAEKSQDTLIEAVKLSKYKDRIQLILAGQGQREEEYRKKAEGLPNQPLFKSYSRTEVIDVLNMADMYVHPAVAELEGIAVLEAIACGKLTLVSDSPDSATQGFAVDKRCIFHQKDPADLAKTIDFWIEHPQESRKVADEYLKSGQALSLSSCMERMEQMFFDVLARRNYRPIGIEPHLNMARR